MSNNPNRRISGPVDIKLNYCIITQNRSSLNLIPQGFQHYFIQTNIRNNIYFRFKNEFEETLKIFKQKQVRCYKRNSLFPDRQQFQQFVFHSNGKVKKTNFKNLVTAKLRQPKTYFNQFRINESNNNIVNQMQNEQKNILFDREQMKQQDKKVKIDYIQNVQKVNQIKQENQEKEKQSNSIKVEKVKKITKTKKKSTKYIADFGQIKIKSKQVFNIISNIELLKQIFKSFQ